MYFTRADLRRCVAQLGTISVGQGSQSTCTKVCRIGSNWSHWLKADVRSKILYRDFTGVFYFFVYLFWWLLSVYLFIYLSLIYSFIIIFIFLFFWYFVGFFRVGLFVYLFIYLFLFVCWLVLNICPLKHFKLNIRFTHITQLTLIHTHTPI